MLDENAALACPSSFSPFQEWRLPTRRIRRNALRSWGMGHRTSPTASGASTNWVRPVISTLSVARKVSARDLPVLSGRPGANARASLGLPRMAVQSAIVAMNLCGAGEFGPLRSVGTTSRAHSGPRTDIAQRAKVGSCPCCVRVTNAAIPPAYALGEFSWLKLRGLALRKAHGPWFPRRLAACQRARNYKRLSKTWDWVPQRLNIAVL